MGTSGEDKNRFEASLRDLACSLKWEDTVQQLQRIQNLGDTSVVLLNYYNGCRLLRATLLTKIKKFNSLKMRLALFSVIGHILKSDVHNRFLKALIDYCKDLIHLERWYSVLTSQLSSLANDEIFFKTIAPNFFYAFRILGVATNEDRDKYMHLNEECIPSSMELGETKDEPSSESSMEMGETKYEPSSESSMEMGETKYEPSSENVEFEPPTTQTSNINLHSECDPFAEKTVIPVSNLNKHELTLDDTEGPHKIRRKKQILKPRIIDTPDFIDTANTNAITPKIKSIRTIGKKRKHIKRNFSALDLINNLSDLKLNEKSGKYEMVIFS